MNCGVWVSKATSAIGITTGVAAEPMMMSALSSVTKRLALLTPLVGSVASSSTTTLTFSPAMVLGQSLIWLAIGMPRPEAGPVSGRLTPMVMSARAAVVPRPNTAAARTVREIFFMAGCLQGRGEVDGRGRSARGHSQGPVKADDLAVEVGVGDDMGRQGRELFGFTQALGERDRGRQRLLHLVRQFLHQRRGEQARRDGAAADAELRQVTRHRQGHAH